MAEIRCPLQEAAQISRREVALTTSEGTLHYEELDQIVSATSLELLAAGCVRGDRVALLMPNDWRHVVLVMALLRIGAVACPLNTRLPAGALRARLDQVSARALITPNGTAPEGVGTALVVWSAEGLVSMVRPDGAKIPKSRMQLGQPATILFTSGSGGRPKAVLHSLGNHYYSAFGSNRNLRVRSKDHWLVSLPLYHVGGLQILFRCFMGGGGIIIPEEGTSLNDAVEKYHPSHLSMVGTQLQRYLRARPSSNGSTGARILVGGGPVSADLLEEAMASGLRVCMSYGLTEMTSQVTTVPPDAPPDKRLTAGRLLSHRDLRIAGDGELLVRGPTRFIGYVEGAAMEGPFDEDGWFATGDLGTLDEDGYLSVIGRKDNMFVSGGENIHPEEIEAALRGVPGVSEAVVVAVEDEEFGRRPVAFVKVEGARGDLDSIEQAVADVLPRYKIPDVVLPWPENGEGEVKPDRKWFAQQASAATRRNGS